MQSTRIPSEIALLKCRSSKKQTFMGRLTIQTWDRAKGPKDKCNRIAFTANIAIFQQIMSVKMLARIRATLIKVEICSHKFLEKSLLRLRQLEVFTETPFSDLKYRFYQSTLTQHPR